jgi:hypothetical protein
MREKKNQHDQRQSFRCQVPESRRDCALSMDGESQEAVLLDQSAGGFAVLAQLAAEPAVGQRAVLQTDAGQFNVRLAHVTRSLPPKDVLPELVEYWTEEQPPASEPWYRLGLVREGETVVLETPRWSPFFGNFLFSKRKFMQPGRVIIFFGIFLVLAVTVLPLALKWAGIGHGAAPTAVGDVSPTGQSRPFLSAAGTDKNNNHGEPFTAPDRPPSRNQQSGKDSSASSSGAVSEDAAAVEELRGMLRRIEGPTPLALPEVVGLLRLTPDQQTRIARIIDAVAEAIRLLDVQAAAEGIPREQVSQLRGELLAKSRHEAEEVLDQRQRRQWQRLTAPPKQ